MASYDSLEGDQARVCSACPEVGTPASWTLPIRLGLPSIFYFSVAVMKAHRMDGMEDVLGEDLDNAE